MIEISHMVSAEDLQALREIFFLSASRQSFDSPEEKERFFFRWTGYYLDCQPKSVWLAKDAQGKLLGYLMGCRDSSAALPFFNENNKSYALFGDLFERFPAHFHVNCHPEARNLGVGSRLTTHFCEYLKREKVCGVHVITTPESDNRRFYAKNGCNFEMIRAWDGRDLLFMGRDL